MRTTRLLGVGIAILLSACLAQAEAFVPPWCNNPEARYAGVSASGQWTLWTDGIQPSIKLHDAKSDAVREYAVTSRDGKSSSRVYALYNAALRNSFVVVLRDLPEVWEISYDPQAAPIFDGLVHDYRMGEAVARPGYQGVRRTLLQAPLTDLYFTEDFRTVIGIAAAADHGAPVAHIFNLDIRREMAAIPLSAPPAPDAAISITADGRTWTAASGLRHNRANQSTLRRYCTP